MALKKIADNFFTIQHHLNYKFLLKRLKCSFKAHGTDFSDTWPRPDYFFSSIMMTSIIFVSCSWCRAFLSTLTTVIASHMEILSCT